MNKPVENSTVYIIGGGLAGSEAAWQMANAGTSVVLYEMRPSVSTDAHKTDGLAELVCSNSFRSDDAVYNAVGLLHEEMRLANSLIMASADKHKLPAGGALAVDRDHFSDEVTAALDAHPNIEIRREEFSGDIPDEWQHVLISSGPLTSESLAETIQGMTNSDELAFFDAIAPIIHKESIDFDKVWFQSRYDKAGPGGTGADYINCPMSEEQYENFIDALVGSEKTEFKEWEKNTPYFDGCLPIEVMAERGRETLRYGPLKPVGLTNPHNPDERLHAVVQLRQDNALGTLWNMVGFQTKMKYGAQKEVFKAIPGLENAEFARLGGLHRNTFLNSPKLLNARLALKSDERIHFAGQITGVEGYVESAATGLLAGRYLAAKVKEEEIEIPPATTAIGSLVRHISGGHIIGEESPADEEKKPRSFQPMNVNFGLFPLIDVPSKVDGQRIKGKEKGRLKKKMMTSRALDDFKRWLDQPAKVLENRSLT